MQSAGGTITAAGLDMKVLGYTKVYDALTRTAGLPLTVGLLGRDTVFRSSQAFALKNVLGLNGSTLHVVAGYSGSEVRRVGKECGSRGSPYHSNKEVGFGRNGVAVK